MFDNLGNSLYEGIIGKVQLKRPLRLTEGTDGTSVSGKQHFPKSASCETPMSISLKL